MPAFAGRNLTSPRLLRPAQGDFEAQVRVRADMAVLTRSPRGGFAIVAGLLVVNDDVQPSPDAPPQPRQFYHPGVRVTCLRKKAAQRPPSVEVNHSNHLVTPVTPDRSRTVAACARKKTSFEAYLKVVRRGDELTSYFSADGKSWEKVDRQRARRTRADVIKGDVRVGVTVLSLYSGSPVKATFDQFKLTPLKPKAK